MEFYGITRKKATQMKYIRNNETINKYLAGMFDGDGNVHVSIKTKQDNGNTYHTRDIRFQISLKNEERNVKVLEWFCDHYEVGNLKVKPAGTRTEMIEWTVYGKPAISLLNRFKKHCVIKGLHIDRSIWVYDRLNKKKASSASVSRYRKWSRDNTKSIKPKNHVTWAWLAGYTDADGSIQHRAEKGRCLRYNCHTRDRAAIDLIAKSFGRTHKVVEQTIEGGDYLLLILPMGLSDRSLGHKILPKLVPHLKIKRWQAEQILSYYNRNNSFVDPLAETK